MKSDPPSGNGSCLLKQQLPLFCIQLPPFSGGKHSKIQLSDTDAQEAEGGMADGCGHPSHLTVLSLGEF